MSFITITDFKAGTFQQQYEYKSFLPECIYRPWKIENQEIIHLMSEANRLLGNLDAYSDLVPNIDYFIRMHITKEATTSSKIEGTKTSFEEALLEEVEDLDPEKRDDWLEVNNYIKAINEAIDRLQDLPISERLIRQIHKTLLDGAQGKDKLPGQFRRSQNWIGPSLKSALFIPPVHTEVPRLMSDLEQLINAEALQKHNTLPHLVRIAIIHYQFETIHPFLDGNGRIGRLLIGLYLIDKGILKKPTLYLSDYFERNRRQYYDHLTDVRTHNDLVSWVKFFLRGIIETAQQSIQAFKDIITLRAQIEFDILPTLGRKQKDAQLLINAMYAQPIMDGTSIARVLERHPSSSNRLIDTFIDLKLLKEITGQRRNRTFAFYPYIDIFR